MMNKKILMGSLILSLGLMSVLGFVMADNGAQHELSEEAFSVSTSEGVLDLPIATKIGGDPANYITISEAVTLETIEGPKEFVPGEKIDCLHEEGTKDPCNRKKLTHPAQSVVTSSGLLDLPINTKIGANPVNYIIIQEEIQVETGQGIKTIQIGAKVDCDPDPGEPNPCDPY